MDISTDEKVATPPPAVEEPAAVAVEETAAPVVETSTPKVTSTPEAPTITTEPTSDEPMVDDKAAVALTLDHSKETPAEKPEEKEPEQESAEDIEMSDHVYSDDDEESEYEPEAETTPKSKLKAPKTPKTPASAISKAPKTPKTARPPKTPLSRVRTGRIDKSSSPATQSTLECPVEGCDQKFIGRNPRQSLWHHLKYYATRGLPDKAEFERKHGEAHAEMKRDAGTLHSLRYLNSRHREHLAPSRSFVRVVFARERKDRKKRRKLTRSCRTQGNSRRTQPHLLIRLSQEEPREGKDFGATLQLPRSCPEKGTYRRARDRGGSFQMGERMAGEAGKGGQRGTHYLSLCYLSSNC